MTNRLMHYKTAQPFAISYNSLDLGSIPDGPKIFDSFWNELKHGTLLGQLMNVAATNSGREYKADNSNNLNPNGLQGLLSYETLPLAEKIEGSHGQQKTVNIIPVYTGVVEVKDAPVNINGPAHRYTIVLQEGMNLFSPMTLYVAQLNGLNQIY